MEKDINVGLLEILFALLIIGPVIQLLSFVMRGVLRIGTKVYYRIKFRKGLKDGTILYQDGDYYEIRIE